MFQGMRLIWSISHAILLRVRPLPATVFHDPKVASRKHIGCEGGVQLPWLPTYVSPHGIPAHAKRQSLSHASRSTGKRPTRYAGTVCRYTVPPATPD